MNNRTYRMYGLVPYNISPIQQGIQFGHAVVEYGLEFGNTPAYQKWARTDKTFIILNGGTTNIEMPGTLNVHEYAIEAAEVQHANFFEPDLGDQLTAVVFLADDRVWDKKAWPDYKMTQDEEENYNAMKSRGGEPDMESFESYRIWFNKFDNSYKEAERIVFLRNLLSTLRLA